MLPVAAFLLYLAVGCILIIMFLLLCVRISVFIEDTCPIRFCLRRKQRKLRKILIRAMLFPDGETFQDPISARPAPPSDENITADIICQPYIYRDAHSTGLTQLSGLSLLANLPLTVALSDVNPSDAVVTNCNSEQMRLALIRRIRPQALSENRGSSTTTTNRNSEITVEPLENENDNIIDTNDDEENDDEEAAADMHSLPPDYSNATNMSSIRIDNETDSINSNYEQPPPSYYECVKFGTNIEENGNLIMVIMVKNYYN